MYSQTSVLDVEMQKIHTRIHYLHRGNDRKKGYLSSIVYYYLSQKKREYLLCLVKQHFDAMCTIPLRHTHIAHPSHMVSGTLTACD